MKTLPVLNEEELRAFFQENLHNAVGKAGSASNCPITRFYRQRYGLDVTTTRSYITHYSLHSKLQRRDVAGWTKFFVRLIDKHGFCLVTGEEALEALDRAILESKEGDGL